MAVGVDESRQQHARTMARPAEGCTDFTMWHDVEHAAIRHDYRHVTTQFAAIDPCHIGKKDAPHITYRIGERMARVKGGLVGCPASTHQVG